MTPVNYKYYADMTRRHHACPSCGAAPGERCEKSPPGNHESRIYTAWNQDEAYRDLADHIIAKLNPPDGEESEYSILIDAIDRAFKCLVDELECWCDDKPGNLEDENPCDRCAALGRYNDVLLER